MASAREDLRLRACLFCHSFCLNLTFPRWLCPWPLLCLRDVLPYFLLTLSCSPRSWVVLAVCHSGPMTVPIHWVQASLARGASKHSDPVVLPPFTTDSASVEVMAFGL